MTKAEKYTAALRAARELQTVCKTSASGVAAWLDESGSVRFWSNALEARDVPALIAWLQATFVDPA